MTSPTVAPRQTPPTTPAALAPGTGREREVLLAQDLRDQAYNEATRSVTGGSALLAALSQLAALGALAAAWVGSRGAVAGAILLAAAGALFIASFMLVVFSMRPRLPRPDARHGWAPLARLDLDEVLAYIGEQAADPLTAYAQHAQVLVRLAVRKHRLFRQACTCVLAGFAIAVPGAVLAAFGL